jgi:hypothetical protein
MNQTTSNGDHIVIKGCQIPFDSLLNHDLLNPKSVKLLAKRFSTNQPFPHIVIDGLFSPVLLELIYDEFDKPRWLDWREEISNNETKRGSLPGSKFGHATQLYFQTIYSSSFVSFLKNIAGIENLITDPELLNGGLHEIPTGGFFKVHKDFTHHSVLGLKNRLTLITYLNKNWDENYGGQLELWNKDMTRCEVKVTPEFGRTILFMHTEYSYHGHPQPVQAPNDRLRRSIAAYYYSPDDTNDQVGKSTETYFMDSTVDAFRVKNIIKSFLPPILIKLGKKLSLSVLKQLK